MIKNKKAFDINNTKKHYAIIAKENSFTTKKLLDLKSQNAYNKVGYNKSGDATITQRINTIIDDAQNEKSLDNIDIQFKYISWLNYYFVNSGENGQVIRDLSSYMENYFSMEYAEFLNLNTGNSSLSYYIFSKMRYQNLRNKNMLNNEIKKFDLIDYTQRLKADMMSVLENIRNYTKKLNEEKNKLSEKETQTEDEKKRIKDINDSLDTTINDEEDELEKSVINNKYIKKHGPLLNKSIDEKEFEEFLKKKKDILKDLNLTNLEEIEIFDKLDFDIKNLKNKNTWIDQLSNGTSSKNIKKLIEKVYDDSAVYYKKVILSLRFENVNIENIKIANDGSFMDENHDEITIKRFNLSNLNLSEIKKIADLKHKEYIHTNIEKIKKNYPFVDFNKIL